MRRWAYQTFRRDDVLHFVAMVTPEDIAANAECARVAAPSCALAESGASTQPFVGVALLGTKHEAGWHPPRYIRLADEFVHVPGGSNRNNYANVELIVKVARRCEADAVWPVRAAHTLPGSPAAGEEACHFCECRSIYSRSQKKLLLPRRRRTKRDGWLARAN